VYDGFPESDPLGFHYQIAFWLSLKKKHMIIQLRPLPHFSRLRKLWPQDAILHYSGSTAIILSGVTFLVSDFQTKKFPQAYHNSTIQTHWSGKCFVSILVINSKTGYSNASMNQFLVIAISNFRTFCLIKQHTIWVPSKANRRWPQAPHTVP